MIGIDALHQIHGAIQTCRSKIALAEILLGHMKSAPDEASERRLLALALRDLQRAEAALHSVTTRPAQPIHCGDC